MNEFLNEYVFPHLGTAISTLGTGLIGFIFGRKKQNAETEAIEVSNDTIEIANADKLIKTYRDSLDDLTTRYEAKFKEIIGLYEQKVKLLNDEITLHKRIIEQLKEENRILRQKLKDNGIN